MCNLKERLLSGSIAYGTMLSEVNLPNIMRILKMCGFEFVIIDCEHGCFDYRDVANLLAVSKCIDLSCFIRVTNPDRECITKYMDMGADGVLLSMTNTPDQVQAVIDAVKYRPSGNRGISTFRPHTDYCRVNLQQYMQKTNERTFVIAQIETRMGVDNIEMILNVDGLDGVMVGPNDMSVSMGIPGLYYDGRLQEIFQRIADAAKRNRKWSGFITSNIELLRTSAAMGMQLLSWSSETNMIAEAGKSALKSLNEMLSPEKGSTMHECK